MERDRYKRGAHTVLELQYHFVWKTKYSYPVLQGDIALRTRDLINQICVEKAMVVVRGNVRANHIHVLVSAPSHLSPAKMAQYLKGKSSFKLMQEFPENGSAEPESVEPAEEAPEAEDAPPAEETP